MRLHGLGRRFIRDTFAIVGFGLRQARRQNLTGLPVTQQIQMI